MKLPYADVAAGGSEGIAPLDAAVLVDGFFHAPLLLTGQEKAERGNETPQTFLEETDQWMAHEIHKIQMQMEREADPDEYKALADSLSELTTLQREVNELQGALNQARAGGAHKGMVMKHILVQGLALFAAITQAVSKGEGRLRNAVLTDQDPYDAKLDALKAQWLARRGTVMTIDDGNNEVLSAVGGVVALSAAAAGANIAQQASNSAELLGQQLASLGLSARELEAMLPTLLSARNAEFDAQVQQLKNGQTKPVDLYNQMVHQRVEALRASVPAYMREPLAGVLLPVFTTDAALQAKFMAAPNVMSSNFTAAIAHMQTTLVPAAENLQRGIHQQLEETDRQLATIEIARNDINRALRGQVFNTEAVSQLMAPEEVAQMEDAIASIVSSRPAAPSLAAAEATQAAYENLLANLHMGQSTGMEHSFASRLKPNN